MPTEVKFGLASSENVKSKGWDISGVCVCVCLCRRPPAQITPVALTDLGKVDIQIREEFVCGL